MKKIFALILIFWCVVTSVAFAKYPLHWNDDKNFPLVWGHHGMADYLDKNSIEIKLNDPPFYIISFKILEVSNADLTEEQLREYNQIQEICYSKYGYEFFYDEEERDMRSRTRFYYEDKGWSEWNDWHFVRPYVYGMSDGLRFTSYGEMAFYVVHRRKFYGNYLWKVIMHVDARKYDENKVRYDDFFSDVIYERL